MKLKYQMSEAYVTAIFLTLSGGFQDAYTYCCRQNVFANAQTGNIVLMSTNLLKGEFAGATRYLISIFAFISGIFFAEIIHRHFKHKKMIHWRQFVLSAEILLLFCVGFVPHSLDVLANVIVSFVCAMQVQSFRKLHGNVFATTMCIGNLRTATEALCIYCHERDKDLLIKSLKYFSIIFLFALGAGLGSITTELIGIKTIWVSCLLLLVSFALLFIRNETL